MGSLLEVIRLLLRGRSLGDAQDLWYPYTSRKHWEMLKIFELHLIFDDWPHPIVL